MIAHVPTLSHAHPWRPIAMPNTNAPKATRGEMRYMIPDNIQMQITHTKWATVLCPKITHTQSEPLCCVFRLHTKAKWATVLCPQITHTQSEPLCCVLRLHTHKVSHCVVYSDYTHTQSEPLKFFNCKWSLLYWLSHVQMYSHCHNVYCATF